MSEKTAGDKSAQFLHLGIGGAWMVQHDDGTVLNGVQPPLDGHVGVFAVLRPDGSMVSAVCLFFFVEKV